MAQASKNPATSMGSGKQAPKRSSIPLIDPLLGFIDSYGLPLILFSMLGFFAWVLYFVDYTKY